MIEFNGVTSDDVGVIIEHHPRLIFPRRKVELYQIPGRNGDRIIDQEVYENYNQPYDVFFDSKRFGGLEAAIPRIASWLLSGTGYGRLEDSYNPSFYRMAFVADAHDFLSYFNEYGRGTLNFNCMPERWYKDGEYEIALTKGQTLYNPSGFKAWPLIRYSSSPGAGYDSTITLTDENGVSREFNSTCVPGGGTTYLDTKEHAILDISTGIYTNPTDGFGGAYTGSYDTAYLGKQTTITWSDSGTMYMIPRWWTI